MNPDLAKHDEGHDHEHGGSSHNHAPKNFGKALAMVTALNFDFVALAVILGVVGVGLYGMLIYVIIAVFIVGLVVGRTPEYLGKKIEPYDIKMASLVMLILALSISRNL